MVTKPEDEISGVAVAVPFASVDGVIEHLVEVNGSLVGRLPELLDGDLFDVDLDIGVVAFLQEVVDDVVLFPRVFDNTGAPLLS